MTQTHFFNAKIMTSAEISHKITMERKAIIKQLKYKMAVNIKSENQQDIYDRLAFYNQFKKCECTFCREDR